MIYRNRIWGRHTIEREHSADLLTTNLADQVKAMNGDRHWNILFDKGKVLMIPIPVDIPATTRGCNIPGNAREFYKVCKADTNYGL